MRRFLLSVLLVILSMSLLSGCGAQPRTMSLSAFQCETSFRLQNETYAGVLQYNDPQHITLRFTTPEVLCGLVLQKQDTQCSLLFGNLPVALDLLQALPLPSFASVQLLELLSLLGADAMSVDEHGAVTGVSGDWTYLLQLDPQTLLPLTLKTDDVSFAFTHVFADDA